MTTHMTKTWFDGEKFVTQEITEAEIYKLEPVVWMYQDKSTHQVSFQKHMKAFVDHGATYETPLYTTPPRREWVGLTEGERVAIAEACGAMSADWLVFIEAVEKALKVKNS